MAQPQQRERDEAGSDLIDRLVAVNRVAKVVKGGRRFGFAALVVMGDGKGKVGYGTGKAKEVSDAVKKATDDAKKKMVRIPLREGRTLHHDIYGRFGSGKVILRTASPGTGIIAGGPMRAVFEALGVQDVVAKSLGSSNPHNMVKATLDALNNMRSPRAIAAKRGKKVGEIIGRREGGLDGKEAKGAKKEDKE
jgi:small subunit ribosomal protein S5